MINSDSEPEYDDNPNPPENTDDEFENDTELKDFMNNPEKNTAMELNKLLNFPDLLDVKKAGQD